MSQGQTLGHVRNGRGRPVSLPPMSIFNRRNALTGWLTWIVAKRVLKKKTKEAVPGTAEGSRWPKKTTILAALAAIGGAVWFWRRRSDDEPSFGYEERPSGEYDPPAADAAPVADAPPADDAGPADGADPAVAEK